jgi:KaiC/GvpD/RAD55 family RecA-like ATPase
LAQILKGNELSMMEHALWIISNINGDTKELKDKVYEAIPDLFEIKMRLLNTPNISIGMRKVISWSTSNMYRYLDRPKYVRLYLYMLNVSTIV